MESFKMQLELKANAITIRVNVWQGVLTTKTFIKKLYPDEQFIPAQIIV